MTSEPSTLKYLRIYADADGESRMEELDIALLPKQIFPGLPALTLSSVTPATGVQLLPRSCGHD